ncbi:transporter substrate-binding domain-containing protein [Aureimonas frigidaquae]|uniref:transporter substrate-binding domain-containing protein n=1 Tax=Aureimonas frigidaquae TaxID=424757 RepID=UPI000A4DE0D1|nr:transporter substrate-binding domain-containing protein [Aureimonas frigidaquae]
MVSNPIFRGAMMRARTAGDRAVLQIAFLLILAFGLAAAAPVHAQAPAQPQNGPIRVGVYVDPPFVLDDNGTYGGMAIELWQLIGPRLDRLTTYSRYATIQDLLNAAASGQIDVAVSNLTITQERAQRMDFTQPWLDSGMRIMVPEQQASDFSEIITELREAGHLTAYALIAIVILVATILVTLFDRRFDRDFPPTWKEGLAESFHTVMLVTTSGKPAARKNLFGWIGRFWQGLWLIVGIAVVAYLTSSITSVMTQIAMTTQINSLNDLPGKDVGVLAGSVSEHYAQSIKLDVTPFASMDEAVSALGDGDIDAIIGDAPVLEYFEHANSGIKLAVVGKAFHPDKYGFALPPDSPLLRPINLQLLRAMENGELERIRGYYFGDNP